MEVVGVIVGVGVVAGVGGGSGSGGGGGRRRSFDHHDSGSLLFCNGEGGKNEEKKKIRAATFKLRSLVPSSKGKRRNEGKTRRAAGTPR